MKRLLVAIVIVIVSSVAATPALAVDVVFDHFDNGVLPANDGWSESFGGGATGFSGGEAGTNFTITNITGGSPFGGFGTYTLSQSFTPINDFAVDFDISWDSGPSDSSRAVQTLGVALLDAGGNQIALAEFRDPIGAGDFGFQFADIGGTTAQTGPDSLPPAGSAQIDIIRNGNQIDILWDGTNLLTGFDATPIAEVQIIFGSPRSFFTFFGTESVDLLRVQSINGVPEPGSLGMLGLIVLAGAISRRRRRTRSPAT